MTQLTVHRSTGGEMTVCHRVAAALKCSDVTADVTCKSCKPGRPWLEMRWQDMDASAPLTLFDVGPGLDLGAKPKPDGYGTPDMFSGLS
jgi:hypothetical protein